MLIYQDSIPVRINDHEARWASRCLICFRLERYALGFKLVLEITNISEDIEFLRVPVPARIKGEDVLFEHPLKQAEDMVSVSQDQPILRSIPGEDFETELFIKTSRCLEVFDG